MTAATVIIMAGMTGVMIALMMLAVKVLMVTMLAENVTGIADTDCHAIMTGMMAIQADMKEEMKITVMKTGVMLITGEEKMNMTHGTLTEETLIIQEVVVGEKMSMRVQDPTVILIMIILHRAKETAEAEKEEENKIELVS